MIDQTESALILLENKIMQGLQRFDSNEDKKIEIKQILQESQLQNLNWSRYLDWKEGVYKTRNLVFQNQQMTILILCWEKDAPKSPIHNHPCDGCFVVGLDGQLQETRYNQLEDKTLQCSEILLWKKGDIMWMHDSIGFHTMQPVDGRAVSLHVYYPPFDICARYNMTGQAFGFQVKINSIDGVLNEL